MTDVRDSLVGRSTEVEAIDRALASVRGGAVTPLVIQGEPGIGKTRLLTELAARADSRGFTVLEGSASELEQDLPFWVFVDALDEHVAGLDPRLTASLPDVVQTELAYVLPSFPATSSGGGEVVPDERYRAHRAVRELLAGLAATQSLVLVLDDVHWADAASIDLIAALIRTPPNAAVLLAMAVRPRQAPDRLAAAFERADRHGALTRLDVDGLPREAAGVLLGPAVGRERADRLYEEAGGNPFYLEQLARSQGSVVGDRSGLDGAALEAVGVPAAVIASLGEELALLSAGTRSVLHGASVAGDSFEPELAAAAAGVDVGDAMEAFDELLAAGLIKTTDVPRRFRFRHPLVRRAVYESAPGGWLLGAHERCAAELAARGAPAAARAHHVEYSARHGDLDAIAVLTEAGSAAMLRAPASAAGWFSAAVRLMPESATVDQRIALLLARARALAAEGRLVESHADLLGSIALAPADAVSLRVNLTATCAGVERLLGRHQEAHARLLAGLDELPDQSNGDAVTLMIELAIDSLFRAEPDAVCDWSGRALQASRELGERPLVAASTALLALGRAVAGAIPDAIVTYEQATALLAAMPDEELGARVDAAAYLASAATYLDRYDEAVAHAERALRLGRAAGHLHPTLLPALGAAHSLRGRLGDAARVLDDGMEAARLAGITQGMAWMLRNRALLLTMTGDVEPALEMAEEALELTRRLDESVLSAWAAMVVARAAVMAGRGTRALEVLVPPDRADVLAAIPAAWRGIGFVALATAYAEAGRPDDAARTVAAAEAHAAALGLPLAAAWAHHAAAAVALLDGDYERAAEHALASAAAAEEIGVVVEAALARVLAGRALAAGGDEDAGVAQLEQAAAVFERAGAVRHRDAAEQHMRGLGRRVHRRSRPGSVQDGNGLAALTEREQEIARLVVDRRTNPEIAAELFLSPKTVETHLRNIFRKVSVTSRVELARAIERADRQI